ncbi:NAD-P-binding protein [Clavulina sp. PMI_390]|nr:NAD-P-binding protein [Clavulina sp. PMI_390]
MSSVVLPKVVLITGCSVGGIGAALCDEYARAGCIVYATARRLEAMDRLECAGDVCKLRMDVTVEESLRDAIKTIINTEGRIDILVNNAGVMGVGPLLDKEPQDAQTIFNTNVFAPLRLAQLVAPHMINSTASNASGTKGLIINIGSMLGIAAAPWDGLYSATKAAIRSLSESMYMEFNPLGIRVMLVQPGCLKSNLADNYAPSYNPPETSFYEHYADAIIAFMHHSQEPHIAGSASDLAREVVRKSDLPPLSLLGKPAPENLRWNPGWYVSVGGESMAFYVFGWLPRRLVMFLQWQAVGIRSSERTRLMKFLYGLCGV